jgi:hypothetical protein
LYEDSKRDSKAAVARLLLVIQEANDLLPIPTTLERHREFSFFSNIDIFELISKVRLIPIVK